ncbi:hypothetical protein C8R45DRAFT_1012977 [Mycena sanguinolenta]|nr:hypothetical protein C8R45DRAFT_1012977 [Mycena sanguinolenta]
MSPSAEIPTPFERLQTFTNESRKSRTQTPIALHRCPSKNIPSSSRASSDDSTASCSSGSSESTSSSASTSKIPRYSSKCKHMVISGISAILLMPMPFLKHGEEETEDGENSEPRGLKRILSRRSRRSARRRNSLVLPDVPMPNVPDEPASPLTESFERTTRDTPPPMTERTVRFVLPPPKFAPPECRGADDEPAWSDFMVRSLILGTCKNSFSL